MAVLVDDVPYLLCNNRDRLFRLQAELLKDSDPTENGGGVHLNRDYSEIYKGDYPCDSRSAAYEISGSGNIYDEVIGLTGGDKLSVQKAVLDGSGSIIELTIDKILFMTNGYDAFILIKCSPIGEKDRPIFNGQSSFVDTYGYYRHESTEKRKSVLSPASPERKLQVPDSINTFVNELADDLYSHLDTLEYRFVYVGTVPMRYVDDHGGESVYYLAVISCGEKGKSGTLLLLDKDKHVLQKIQKDYSGIIGLLDPDCGGSHLVALGYGDGYGGGVELMAFDRTTGLLQTEIRICTVFD